MRHRRSRDIELRASPKDLKFKEPTNEIKKASTCHALGRDTAAVFHLTARGPRYSMMSSRMCASVTLTGSVAPGALMADRGQVSHTQTLPRRPHE